MQNPLSPNTPATLRSGSGFRSEPGTPTNVLTRRSGIGSTSIVNARSHLRRHGLSSLPATPIHDDGV